MSKGTAYGKGYYFAKTAALSNGYAKPNEAINTRKMFLARVIVGEYARGDPTMSRPPPRNSAKPFGDLYDSCVNSLPDPIIFVIFENSQCYPEWLIEN